MMFFPLIFWLFFFFFFFASCFRGIFRFADGAVYHIQPLRRSVGVGRGGGGGGEEDGEEEEVEEGRGSDGGREGEGMEGGDEGGSAGGVGGGRGDMFPHLVHRIESRVWRSFCGKYTIFIFVRRRTVYMT